MLQPLGEVEFKISFLEFSIDCGFSCFLASSVLYSFQTNVLTVKAVRHDLSNKAHNIGFLGIPLILRGNPCFRIFRRLFGVFFIFPHRQCRPAAKDKFLRDIRLYRQDVCLQAAPCSVKGGFYGDKNCPHRHYPRVTGIGR